MTSLCSQKLRNEKIKETSIIIYIDTRSISHYSSRHVADNDGDSIVCSSKVNDVKSKSNYNRQ